MTQAEYRSKKHEVIEKFKEEFIKENLYTDAMFNTILEMLIRDADPYQMIEELINDRKKY